jgi:hypothetical protein
MKLLPTLRYTAWVSLHNLLLEYQTRVSKLEYHSSSLAEYQHPRQFDSESSREALFLFFWTLVYIRIQRVR